MTAKDLQRVSEGGSYCHVYNKGIEGRNLFQDEDDYNVFLGYLEDYLSAPKSAEKAKKDFVIKGRTYRGVPHQPKNYFNKIELIAYSLKPNHFHLLLHQKAHKSLQGFIRSLCTRYSIYYNKKYSRGGSLFEGPYKSVNITNGPDIIPLIQYLHEEKGNSSYPQYADQKNTPWLKTNLAQPLKNSGGEYTLNKKDLDLLEKIAIDKKQVNETPQNNNLERINLKSNKPEKVHLQPWLRIPELIASGAMFAILLGYGIRNVNISSASATTLGAKVSATSSAAVSPSPAVSPQPTASPLPEILVTVKKTDIPINIRSQPSKDSKVIGVAQEGDTFPLVSEDGDWDQIKLSDGSGFIFSSLVEKQK